MGNATLLLDGLDRSRLMVITTDRSGRVTHANDAAKALFGDLDGLDFSQPPVLQNPKSPLAILVGFWDALREDASAGEPSLLRVECEVSSTYLWAHSIALSEGEESGHLILVADLTAHVAGAEPVQRLVAQLTHDLRSPLTSISGAAELLLSGRVGSLQKTQQKLVRIVDDGATKMTSIIQVVAEENSGGGSAT